MTRFPFLAQQLFNTPLLLHPDKAEMIVAALADRLGVTHIFRDGRLVFGRGATPQAYADVDAYSEAENAYQRGYDICDGIAQVPICGTLVPKLRSARPYSGMTGYDTIRNAVLGAYVDPQVKAIALNIDSPGGACIGCFDLVDTIVAGRGLKPVWAIIDASACSAAYAIASAADRIVLPRVAFAGSIGVIVMHTDLSGALAKDGIAVTLITYGAKKADGAPTGPLSESARADMQADVDTIGELFVATVAANRRISPDAVRNTEAGVFMGPDAVTAKLADAVMAPDEAHRALLATL